jgi:predicted DNA-binding WGR domain protein
MSSNGRKELDQFPKYKAAYFRAAQRYIEHRKASGLPEKDSMQTQERYFEWWLNGKKVDLCRELFEEGSEEFGANKCE